MLLWHRVAAVALTRPHPGNLRVPRMVKKQMRDGGRNEGRKEERKLFLTRHVKTSVTSENVWANHCVTHADSV